MTLRNELQGVQQRSITLEKRNLDEEARTVEVAFSSEYPVERYFGNEILDHSPESVRLGRLQDGGAVLVGHDHDDQVGVIESVRIDEDRIGRAVLRFGKSQRAEEIYQDVKDGIRRLISVGYRIHKYEETRGQNGAPAEIRATDWEPFEISFVSVPADPTAQVGRDDAETTHTVESSQPEIPAASSEIREENIMTEQVTPAVINTDDAIKTERERAAAITALGAKFGLTQQAREAIDSGMSLARFSDSVIDSIQSAPVERNNAHLDLSKEEVRRYDLFKAVRAAESGDWSKAGFERELSLELAEKFGREANGFYVPYNVQVREMDSTTATGGGDLVGTDHLAGSFIDTLRAASVLGQTGATYLTGLVGNVDIPKRTSDGTTYWLAEGEDVTNADQVTATVALSPKTIAQSVPLTRRLLKQGSPDAQNLILSGIAANMALGIDKAALQGTAANGQPRGILNQTGINTVTITAAGQPTWANLVGFETAVETDNALSGSLSYVVAPGVKGHCKVTSKDTGSGRFLMEGNEINGYRAISTTQMPANGILFGNFSDVIVGMWGMLDVMVDDKASAASGGLVLRCFQDVDIAVRNAVSFAKNA